ncbi:MAG TPA: 16S rRNA (uracil(1498)-N(3))-methyltransferase [Gammaproteobacteria bacterium]|nr:16S rRNA (uracil(1498)-N(3))-methyltransferase [Gammaproteobacteria bacterium]
MRLTRLYTPRPLATGTVVSLDERAARHCARVLRMRSGDAVILFNGEGGEYQAHLTRIARTTVDAEVGEYHDVSRESPLHITLHQALARGERMDYALQKAVELGVATLAPVITRRCVVQLDAGKLEKRMAHWRGVIISACEQSGRTRLPRLLVPQPLAELVARPSDELRLVLSPTAEQGLSELQDTGITAVSLLVGPEGGLEESEIAACVAAGHTALRFGPRILRTETAGTAIIAALQSRWGDLGT